MASHFTLHWLLLHFAVPACCDLKSEVWELMIQELGKQGQSGRVVIGIRGNWCPPALALYNTVHVEIFSSRKGTSSNRCFSNGSQSLQHS